ncbi:MAG: GspE/PulE family protein [Janthinobacterium lividum]
MQTLSAPRTTIPRMGDILIEMGIASTEQIKHALEAQASTGQRLGTILISNGWATEEQVTEARSVQMDVGYINITQQTPDPFAVALVPLEIAQRYLMLPLSMEEGSENKPGRLQLAMVDPWDVEATDWVQRETRRRIEPLLASETGLMIALERAYQSEQNDAHSTAMSETMELASLDSMDLAVTDAEELDLGDNVRQGEQAPVIRFVNTLFSEAVRRRTSDIHIEPRKKDFLIRYRVDGQLQTIKTVPRNLLAATVSRIKILAEMDIAERRLPLDGRISMRVEGKNIDLRVSTLPTQYGERVVMRILDRSTASMGLDELGFSPHNLLSFNSLIRKPHGIILVTGPTGSGKTTTLYAALNALRSPTTNIITCEDPVEYELEGISQSNVNERSGLTFARQLRAILRQDPDIVLVGEIRDAETAEIAFRAALTGHLVLSTLHCNEAAGAVSRLLDMGVAPFLIASTVAGVVAQRLVRRLCPHCRRETFPDEDTLAMYRALGGTTEPGMNLWEATGCVKCDGKGTRGRVAVHEVLVTNTHINRLTMESAETNVIREAAIENGMIPMIGDGLAKVRAGLTLLDDVQRKIGVAITE